jgi:benzoyl-CoA reductase/2-hydroxyglutaryl-CoA dehydratase subunit BcrC/BadD/HgdB
MFDTPMIESALNKLNIPTVVVEIDAPLSLGQVRIRVESLLDMIRIET